MADQTTEDPFVQRLRLLMGEEMFNKETVKGTALKIEAETKRKEAEEAEELERAKHLAEENTKLDLDGCSSTGAAQKDSRPELGTKPDTELETGSPTMDEFRKMLGPRKYELNTVGEIAPPKMDFCPIMAVAKYPYKFMYAMPEESDKVSKNFFASNRFWDLDWSLWYLYPPVSMSTSPLILVPASEVELFLKAIGDWVGRKMPLHGKGGQRGLLLDFPDVKTPRPRYLGVSDSKEVFVSYERSVPAMPDDDPLLPKHAMKEWEMKIEDAIQVTKNKRKSKEKKQKDRAVAMSDWTRQLRRTQRYLGLREHNSSEKVNALYPGQPYEEHSAISIARTFAAEEAGTVIDVEKAPLHPFDSEVVFTSIDVEVYERDHSSITEVGIAVLDTTSLTGLSPGPAAKYWLPKVKARHFIVNEYKHLVNSKYVHGCPHKFEEHFGVSETISVNDIKDRVTECLQSFDKDGNHRPVILVGHDIAADISFLRQLEFDITKVPGILETIDTSNMMRFLSKEIQPTSLGKVLQKFNITGWNLHNAGNDAGYTLQALLAITVTSSKNELTTTAEDQREVAKEEGEELGYINAEEDDSLDEGGEDAELSASFSKVEFPRTSESGTEDQPAHDF